MAKLVDSFQLALIGDSGVGKTCVVTRYADNQFKPPYEMTIGELCGVVCGVAILIVSICRKLHKSKKDFVEWKDNKTTDLVMLIAMPFLSSISFRICTLFCGLLLFGSKPYVLATLGFGSMGMVFDRAF